MRGHRDSKGNGTGKGKGKGVELTEMERGRGERIFAGNGWQGSRRQDTGR